MEPVGERAGVETSEQRQDARRRWLNALYTNAFLIFLVFPYVAAWQAEGWRRPASLVLLTVFAVIHAVASTKSEGLLEGVTFVPTGHTFLAVQAALALGVVAVIGAPGLGTTFFVAVAGAATLKERQGLMWVLGTGVVTTALGFAFGLGWMGAGIGAFAVLVGLVVWASLASDRSRQTLMAAREEKAELAVELERTRLARDLHDLLGHTLTVITVKAELAGRLMEQAGASGPQADRARAEIAEVERLSRDALRDVRSTVSGYRQLSLPAELSKSGRALEAAGIHADLPGATDLVAGEAARDLFAWVVREAVTNVIRHSGARTCTVMLTENSVEVRDDGRARPSGSHQEGNGLVGLRERARQAGASIVAEPCAPNGFRVKVTAGVDT